MILIFENVLFYFSKREKDLLVLDICGGEGWEKLCKFLHVPVPNKKFPKKFVKNARIKPLWDKLKWGIYHLINPSKNTG